MPGRAAAAPGLETLRRVIAGELPSTPMARLMDIRLTEADPGRAVFEAMPAEFHYNFSGGVHGGFAATLLDSAMACAIYTTLDAGQNCPTLELKINYVKAITRELGPVRGIGTVLHRGRTTALAEGRVEDAGGVLLAHATTTCLIVAGRPRRRTAAPATRSQLASCPWQSCSSALRGCLARRPRGGAHQRPHQPRRQHRQHRQHRPAQQRRQERQVEDRPLQPDTAPAPPSARPASATRCGRRTPTG